MEQNRIPGPGEIYRHFKGELYQIITVAAHSETGEAMVVYQALYGDFKTYVRPLDMFVSKVDRVKYPMIHQEYRFQLEKMESEANEDRESQEKKADGETGADPDLAHFLDADSNMDKLDILISLKNKINERLIDDIGTSMDIILEEGSLEERYEILKDNLLTRIRFESSRRQ